MCIRDSRYDGRVIVILSLGSGRYEAAELRVEITDFCQHRTHDGGTRRQFCLLYTSDAADERSSVDLGGRRIIKKKNTLHTALRHQTYNITNKQVNKEKN